MALPRVDAVMRSSPVQMARPRDGSPLPGPAPGATLQLALQQRSGDDLLAVSQDGVAMRLPGLAHLADELAVGDTLTMRVVSAGARLELALIESLARTRQGVVALPQNGPWAEPPAMRFDQLALQHAARASVHDTSTPNPPPGVPLADSWRAQVLAPLLGLARSPLPAASSRSTSRTASAPGASASALLLQPPGAERWLFHLHTALGVPLQLRLVESESDETEHAPAQQQAGAVALRLSIVLERLGRIALRLRSVNGGIALILVLAQDNAVAPVRAALPGLALALVRARISLRSCRLLREPALSGDRALPAELHAAGPRIAAGLPAALFRTAAEAVLALVAADAAAES